MTEYAWEWFLDKVIDTIVYIVITALLLALFDGLFTIASLPFGEFLVVVAGTGGLALVILYEIRKSVIRRGSKSTTPPAPVPAQEGKRLRLYSREELKKEFPLAERKDCRSCGGVLETLFSLGNQPIINFGEKERLEAPLELTKCASCHLVQLRHTVDRDRLFRTYYYKSGTNTMMREHLKGIVDDVMKQVFLAEDDVVLDIGANDGTLLGYYPKELIKVGFEPANITGQSYDDERTICYRDFFNAKTHLRRHQHAKVITAIAMFYDLDDPNAFLQDVKRVLAPDGLFVIEMNYLPSMLKSNDVGNLVHEHLCYYSVNTLTDLLQRNGFYVEGVGFNPMNGGSMRAYVRHRTLDLYNSKRGGEKELELETKTPYLAFRDRIYENAYKLKAFVTTEVVSKNKRVYVLGASTRGLQFLRLAELDGKLVPFAVEKNPDKVGKVYGGGIMVISEEKAEAYPPDYYLILPQHFLGGFITDNWEYLHNGGKFITVLPQPAVLGVEKI